MGQGRKKGRLRGLTQREGQVLTELYALGEATAADLQIALDDDMSNATVRMILRTLEDKNRVTHSVDGRTFVYRPTVAHEDAAKRDFRRIVDTFFSGSMHKAVVNVLDESASKISAEELDELAKLIDQHRQERNSQ